MDDPETFPHRPSVGIPSRKRPYSRSTVLRRRIRGQTQFIGHALQEVLIARLAVLFPDTPCVVEVHLPDDRSELDGYQFRFWQEKDGADST